MYDDNIEVIKEIIPAVKLIHHYVDKVEKDYKIETHKHPVLLIPTEHSLATNISIPPPKAVKQVEKVIIPKKGCIRIIFKK
jgi:hypothetical protein